MHNIFTKETDPNFKVKHEVQNLHREENGAQNEVVKFENEGEKGKKKRQELGLGPTKREKTQKSRI